MQKVITHVGLDVHAERIAIASLVGQAREPNVWDIPNDEKVIRRTFRRLARESRELRCCYEAGPCGFELHRQLTAMGIECEVVAPSLIPVRSGDRVKTDPGTRRSSRGFTVPASSRPSPCPRPSRRRFETSSERGTTFRRT